jgi:signal recognition particle GTPase
MATQMNFNTIIKGGLGGKAFHHIFRYKLSDDIMLLISQFAKIHQYDDRHTYKDAWEHQWLVDYSEMVEREVSRLQQLGYKGDIIDKMYKAGRYYFREKESIENKSKEEHTKEKTVKQRTYCIMNSDVINAMDNHLMEHMKETGFKPANAYKNFCETHINILREEIIRLVHEEETMTSEKISDKIKKTYKNRYFILSKQQKQG